MNDMKEYEPTEKGNEKDTEEPVDSMNGASSDLAGLDNKAGGPDKIDEPGESTDKGDEALTTEELQRLLAEKEEELAQKHDRLLRAQADYENYKKRMAREKQDLLKFGNERLMKDLLPVLDNFERSLMHARNAQSTSGIVDGIELIHKELLNTLTKFGLREISSRGEKFDPAMHEATAQLPTGEHEEGTVIEEFQKGYFVHDRLLRPAMVAVAGPSSDSEGEEGNQG